MCIEYVFRKCYNYRFNRYIVLLIRNIIEFISVLMYMYIYIDFVNIKCF